MVLAFSVERTGVLAVFWVFFALTGVFLIFFETFFGSAFLGALRVRLADFALTLFVGFLALSFFAADFFAIKSCPPEKSSIEYRPVSRCRLLKKSVLNRDNRST